RLSSAIEARQPGARMIASLMVVFALAKAIALIGHDVSLSPWAPAIATPPVAMPAFAKGTLGLGP
ncbi:MAG TPA: hypothetical protein VJT50_10500, partial [Pyrinomonadaceae bacterium]|nr:hypothetical protein [Pyrinomonadaceae bacterium]